MYYLDDPEAAANLIRKRVVKAHGLPDEERYVTNGQVVALIVEKCEKDGSDYIVTDELLKEITGLAETIALGAYLSEMAANGELECAWDSEKNDMVWWRPKDSEDSDE